MKKNILFVCALILLSACTGKGGRGTDVTYTAFGKEVSLQSVKHDVPPVSLYPRNMFLADSFLVVYNDKMDTLFQVFDKTTFDYKYGFGITGGGPNDFNTLSTYWVSSDGKKCVMQDMQSLREVTIENGHPVIKSRMIPAQQSVYNGMVQLEDSVLLCDADMDKNEVFMFIYPNGETKNWGSYPESAERFGGDLAALKDAYTGYTVASPKGDRFASFYAYLRRFRIFNSKGELLKAVTLNIDPCDAQVSADPEKRCIYPIAVYATDNYIYTLNLDMTAQEIGELKHFPSIQVFTWEGEPVAKYNLDCMISCFTIDEAAKCIYGMFVENEHTIYTFQMD